jgi:tRNA pseudouridine38-40 synthase
MKLLTKLFFARSIVAWSSSSVRQLRPVSNKLKAASYVQEIMTHEDPTEAEQRLALMWEQAPFRTVENLVNGTLLGLGSTTGLKRRVHEPGITDKYDDTLFVPLFRQESSDDGTDEGRQSSDSEVTPIKKQRQKKNFALTVAYRGPDFCGWQTQVDNSLPSVQQSLEEHLSLMDEDRYRVDVRVCGRTDSGVHAIGQVCRFRTRLDVDRDDVLRHMESFPLSSSLRILEVKPVSPKFHPSFGSTCRAYVYMIDEGFLSEAEIDQLNNMLQELENKTLDYIAVSYGKIKTQSTVCTLFCARTFRLDDNGGVCIQLVGNRFLRRMVRILVSTALLRVFEGETSLVDILEPKDRSLSARPAPPGGLIFVGADFETM